jgi:hypothetical protein
MKTLYVALFLLIASALPAFAKVPACMDKTTRMEFNESQVLVLRDLPEYKLTARAFVEGILVRVMEDRQRHIHFEVDLDADLVTTDDRVEVIYNTKFGPVPDHRPGDQIIACGDFVVDPYSPLRGVIHWLHMSPKLKTHDHGFLIINGTITGLINPKPETK